MKRGMRSRMTCSAAAMAAVLAVSAATAGAPAKRTVLVVGDSMMKIPAGALAREFAAYPDIEVVPNVRIGTGLARLDMYDWHGALRQAASLKPEAAVVWFGGNDAQPMKTDAGLLEVGTPAWNVEYGRRVAQTLAILKEIGVRHILWIGMPDMRDSRLQQCGTTVTRIVKEQTAAAGAIFFDTVPVLSVTPGKFSPYVLGPKALPIVVRSSDGGHLNMAGAELLAARLMVPLGKALGLPAKAP